MNGASSDRSILIACDVTAPGGVSVYLVQLARAARTVCSGADILLDDGPGADPVERFLIRHDVAARRVPMRTDRRSENEVERLFGSILDDERPDIVHAVLGSPRSLLVPRETCLKRGIPLVMTEQYVARDLVIPAQMLARIRLIYRQASAVIFVSAENERLADQHFGFIPQCGFVIPNAVDCEPVRPRRESDSKKVLCVARLAHQKGIDVLIRAAAALETPRLRVSVAGDGELRPQLQSLASELGLSEERFRLLGWHDDISDLLAAHDLFVLPSRAEGQPFALLEALSRGVPCIASTVSGIPEALGHGRFGDLVPPEDPAALAAAIERFFRAPANLWGKADCAAEHLRHHFDAKANLTQVAEIWRKIAPGKVCASGKGA